MKIKKHLPGNKECTNCKKLKPRTDFYLCRQPDGHYRSKSECKKCTIKRNLLFQKKSRPVLITNPEYLERKHQYRREYYRKNKDKFKAYREQFLLKNPDYFKQKMAKRRQERLNARNALVDKDT